MESSSYFDILPDEILDIIFSYLEYSTYQKNLKSAFSRGFLYYIDYTTKISKGLINRFKENYKYNIYTLGFFKIKNQKDIKSVYFMYIQNDYDAVIIYKTKDDKIICKFKFRSFFEERMGNNWYEMWNKLNDDQKYKVSMCRWNYELSLDL